MVVDNSSGSDNKIINKLFKSKRSNLNIKIPNLIQILQLPISNIQKNYILEIYTILQTNLTSKNKLTWFDALMKIPFGKYMG